MTTNTKTFTNLDFQKSKSDLIDFLKTKTEFRDFNFDGPAITLLIEALTYTTHQMAIYANMSISECFLDSAQIRSNVVSQAKSMSYIPRSRSSAYAEIELTLTLDPAVSSNLNRLDLFVEKGTQFSSEVNENSFNFITLDQFQLLETRNPYTDVVLNPGVYKAKIVIFEGLLTTESFIYQETESNQLFDISNKNIDINTLSVLTRPSKSSTTKTDWFRADNVTNIGPEDNVFFAQEGPDGFYQIYFGDGVIGAQPSPTTFIMISYLATKGPEANGVRNFEMIGSVKTSEGKTYNGRDFAMEVLESSGYGSEQESIDSIKNAAPRAWMSQNRAVTNDDYVSLLDRKYGFIETMSVWGGQDNIPPEYGKVFISIKPKYGNFLSPLTKQQIQSEVLDPYSVISITPTIVDPDFSYVYVASTVMYRKEQTTLTIRELRDRIGQQINEFFDSAVSFFKGEFRYSKFVAVIDNTDPSIQGNTTSVLMAKILNPTPNLVTTYDLSFYNPIIRGQVRTEQFKTLSGEFAHFRDDSGGYIDLYIGQGAGVLVRSKIGTVDYATGSIVINDYNFTVPVKTSIVLKAAPLNFNLKTVRNNLIVLKDLNIQVLEYTPFSGNE